jgi:ankyrin repeat protein
MIYDDCNELWPFDLLTASAVGDDEAVGQLLSDPDLKTLKNSKGWTPIMFAAYFGHSSLVASLISSCWFDVRDRNDKGGHTSRILETVDNHSARLLDVCAI